MADAPRAKRNPNLAKKKALLEKALFTGGMAHYAAIEHFGKHPGLSIGQICSETLKNLGIEKNDLTFRQRRILYRDIERFQKNWRNIFNKIKTGRLKFTTDFNKALKKRGYYFVNNKILKNLGGKAPPIIVGDLAKARVGPFGVTLLLDSPIFEEVCASLGKHKEEVKTAVGATGSLNLASGEILPISFIRKNWELNPRKFSRQEKIRLIRELLFIPHMLDLHPAELKLVKEHERAHRQNIIILEEVTGKSMRLDLEHALRQEILSELMAPSYGRPQSPQEVLSEISELHNKGEISDKEFAYYNDFTRLISETLEANVRPEIIVTTIRKTPFNRVNARLGRLLRIQKASK